MLSKSSIFLIIFCVVIKGATFCLFLKFSFIHQSQGGDLNHGYKESNNLEESEGGRQVETEMNDDDDDDNGTSSCTSKDISGNRHCRSCGKVESCVLLLPCRHLCVCNACDASLRACPICYSTKNASVRINTST